jgi:hypothetical protein
MAKLQRIIGQSAVDPMTKNKSLTTIFVKEEIISQTTGNSFGSY